MHERLLPAPQGKRAVRDPSMIASPGTISRSIAAGKKFASTNSVVSKFEKNSRSGVAH
jgi:hypothetical protein